MHALRLGRRCSPLLATNFVMVGEGPQLYPVAFGAFGETDLDLLAAFANQAAAALENARLYQGLEQRVAERTAELLQSNKVQSALFKIAEAASAAADMDEFYRAVHVVVGQLMLAENFFIALAVNKLPEYFDGGFLKNCSFSRQYFRLGKQY